MARWSSGNGSRSRQSRSTSRRGSESPNARICRFDLCCGVTLNPVSRDRLEGPKKLQSYTISQGRDRAPARAILKAIGFTDEDLKKPIIGIANTWIETMPCNYNLRELAVKVKEVVRAAGGPPMEFNTIAISDGTTMGTEGMKD